MCYRHALDAFEMLCKDCSGYSMQLTLQFLTKMVNGQPITPISDSDFGDNSRSYYKDDGTLSIQCPRMTSLFKYIHTDGTITYTDINRVLVKIIKNSTHWTNGLITRVVDEMYPIKMPYMPTTEKFIANVDEYLFNKDNGDYDAIKFVSLKHPDGTVEDINRYFMEIDHKFTEVSEEVFKEHENKCLFDKKNA
jgi:hypothetical protein